MQPVASKVAHNTKVLMSIAVLLIRRTGYAATLNPA
jgi:hypothetical protein